MEKMIKLNKSKIAELIAKKHLTVKMVAGAACLAYTTCKHIIQEGKDSVDTTSIDKAERLAKALGTTVKAITIGKPYDRYPKKATPAKTTAKKPTTKKAATVKTVVIKAKEKAAENLGKKIAEALKNTTGQHLEVPEAKLPENSDTENSDVNKLLILNKSIVDVHERVAVLISEVVKMNERIAKLEKIVLKTSSRKKLVKVE